MSGGHVVAGSNPVASTNYISRLPAKPPIQKEPHITSGTLNGTLKYSLIVSNIFYIPSILNFYFLHQMFHFFFF
jgi:hypothetical protein